MKKYILYFVVFCISLTIFAQSYPKQANTIRLLTYNTHYCKGGSDPGSISEYNTRQFAAIIKALDADIVALQELDSACNGRGKRNLIEQIAKFSELDYTPVFGNAAKYDGGGIGCGTLIKKAYPISKIKNIPLPGKNEARIAVRTDLDKFVFISTHGDLDDAKREQGAQIIVNELDYIRKPVFLAGDLNDSFCWNSSFNTYLENFEIASSTEGSSLPGRTDSTQSLIDYILFRDYKNSAIKVMDTHIVKTITLKEYTIDLADISDHYPVFIDIEIPNLTNLDNITDDKFQTYPNPVNDILNLNSQQEINHIEIYSATGAKITELSGTQINKINLSTLTKGVFFIKAFADKENFIRKIIKN